MLQTIDGNPHQHPAIHIYDFHADTGADQEGAGFLRNDPESTIAAGVKNGATPNGTLAGCPRGAMVPSR
jgi:hypothetical protein